MDEKERERDEKEGTRRDGGKRRETEKARQE